MMINRVNASISLSNVFYNAKVLKIAKNYIESVQSISSPEFEIQQNKKYKKRHIFHNLTVKSVFAFLCRMTKQELQDLSSHRNKLEMGHLRLNVWVPLTLDLLDE